METKRKTLKIVTIEHARSKLDKLGERMSDKDIERLLTTLRILCNKSIDSVIDRG